MYRVGSPLVLGMRNGGFKFEVQIYYGTLSEGVELFYTKMTQSFKCFSD
ncbi:hypothetical protein SAMN05216406_11826 [Nitrosomonas ureae]|uniref:Uncharacterized protein n=1 Tax=Nitrosomonas ureae TaxID=44577 RepID=A0A1H2F6N8_9PROT|nr:hypothetical protein SAMN05216406_11826 [Nitrosomonas ureae]